jgi:hypothetical protein
LRNDFLWLSHGVHCLGDHNLGLKNPPDTLGADDHGHGNRAVTPVKRFANHGSDGLNNNNRKENKSMIVKPSISFLNNDGDAQLLVRSDGNLAAMADNQVKRRLFFAVDPRRSSVSAERRKLPANPDGGGLPTRPTRAWLRRRRLALTSLP